MLKRNKIIRQMESHKKTLDNLKIILETLEVQIESKIYDYVFSELHQTRIKALKYALNNKYNLKDAALFFGISKHQAWNLQRYEKIGVVKPKLRSQIIQRDASKCQKCGKIENLHVHHIGDPKSIDPSNLITLCAMCHKREHKKAKNEKI